MNLDAIINIVKKQLNPIGTMRSNRNQAEADLYRKFTDKQRATLDAGLSPDLIPVSPSPDEARAFIGESEAPQQGGLGSIISGVRDMFAPKRPMLSPVADETAEPVSLSTIQTTIRKPKIKKDSPLSREITPTPSPIRNPVPTVTAIPQGIAPDVQAFLEQKILPTTRKYGVPDAIAAGQFAQEGRLQGVGADLNNHFNMSITDSMVNSGDYSNAMRFETPEMGAEAFAKFITGVAEDTMYANGVDASKSGKIGKKQLQDLFKKYKNDPEKFLRGYAPMYSSQQDEYANNVTATPEWRTYINPKYPRQ